MINNEIIESYLNCKYKAYRKLNNEHGTKKEFEIFQGEQLSSCKTEFYNRLLEKYGENKLLNGFKFENNQWYNGELKYYSPASSNPLDFDTDGDHLLDGKDMNSSEFPIIKNPSFSKIYGEYFKENDTYIFWGESNYYGGWESYRLDEDFDNDGLHDGNERWFGSSAWDQDIDEDGLDDSQEFRYNKWSYGEKNGADPNKQDIFVEVDWMGKAYWKIESLIKYPITNPITKKTEWYSWWKTEIKTCDGHKLDRFYIDEKDERSGIETVEGNFKKHGIRLHIDDGCMGGGEEIQHKDYLTEDMEDFLYDNDGLDGTGGYGFSPERKDIFHYCIFAHKGAKESSKDNPDGDTGEGERGGDEFQIFDALNGILFDKAEDQAKSFMHELGHNLDLGHGSKKSVMYKYPLEAENIDYTSWEWSIINLTGSFN